ncbi:MAG: hypothetical protein AAGB04_03985 [Pseudomonadota bacterium]
MSDTKTSAHLNKLEGRARPGSSDTTVGVSGSDEQAYDILHLAELVPIVRKRFYIEQKFSDDAILASLKTIAAATTDRERSSVAFTSNLGRYLDSSSQQKEAGLAGLIAMLPRPRS